MIMDNFDSPFLYDRPEVNVDSLKKTIVYKLIFLIGRSPKEASQRDWLNATLYAVRDFVTEGWITTAREARAEDARRVYYLSMEFLIGRTLSNAMIAEGLYDIAKEALSELNVDLEEIIEKVTKNLDQLLISEWGRTVTDFIKSHHPVYIEHPRLPDFEAMKVDVCNISDLQGINIMASPDF